MQPDYLLLGHFTRDLLPDRSTMPGGTSLYASLAAQHLGRKVGVVSAPADLPASWPVEIELAFFPSSTPTFENIYGSSGRQQILHSAATPIALEHIPAEWRATPVVHLAPILAETPAELVFAFPGALIGATPQGWMRTWPIQLPGPINYRAWQPDPAVLARIDALVLSIEDVRGDEALALSYTKHCRLVVVTRGPLGATLYLEGQPHQVSAFPAAERDPTGAGDVFAATLITRLHETGDPLAAAHFAAFVAARSIEGVGVSSLPSRAVIDASVAAATAPGQARSAGSI